MAGVRVALSVPIPWFFYMGNERVGSSLSIAVDPADSDVVYLAWGDNSGSTNTLHVRRSTDRGATWSSDLLTVDNATNPSLAIAARHKVGLLYQRFVAAATQRWETHVQVSRDAWRRPAEDILLANTPVDGATYVFDPYIGDYADLQALGHDFYGIFSAHNLPDIANFPTESVISVTRTSSPTSCSMSMAPRQWPTRSILSSHISGGKKKTKKTTNASSATSA